MRQGPKQAKTEVRAKRPATRVGATVPKLKAQAGRLTANVAPKRSARKPEKPGSLEQQKAISEILRVMSTSPGDVKPVLDVVAERAAFLCEAPFARVALVDGDVMRPGAEYSIDGTLQPRTVPLPLKRSSILGRAVLDRRTVHHDDVVPLLEIEYPDAVNARRLGLRAVLAVPLMREDNAYGAVFLFRREPRAFSQEQVALVETFAQQAAIAIDNARRFKETKEALEQQTATSEILRVIASSPGNVQPMLSAVVERAARLCEASNASIFLVEGDKYRSAARFGSAKRAQELGQPMPLTRGSAAGRAIIDRMTIHLEDLAVAAEEEYPTGRQWQRIVGHHTLLAVPLMQEDRAIGAFALFRMEVRPFTEKQITLVKTFADQAAIGIENVRLFNETQEALERQTATSDILRVISQSPTSVQPVFDAIVQSAKRVFGARTALATRVVGDSLHLAAFSSVDPDADEALKRIYPVPVAGTLAEEAVRTGEIVAVSDVLTDPRARPAMREVAQARGFRSMLVAPMLRDGVVIGTISFSRAEPGQFSDHQQALLKTFADQAVIAIENVRLFNETKDALERQTATSEILRVISQSPKDLQPVFDTIVESVVRLCGGWSASLYRWDGAMIHHVAMSNPSDEDRAEYARFFPTAPTPELPLTPVVTRGELVHVADCLSDPTVSEITRQLARQRGYRVRLLVPMFRAGSVVGAIGVSRVEPGLFTEAQVRLVQTFADQAVIAIENVRLFTELETRTAQLTRSVGELRALGEVGQAVSSTLDLETVLRTIVSRATRLAGMDGGSVWEYDEAREQFDLHATDQLPDELVEVLGAAPIPKGEGAIGRLALTGEPVEIRDIVEEASYQSRVREILIRLGFRSLLAVPLLSEDRLLGGLVVNRKRVGEFAPEVIELLKTFATQSALAIQNARLYREIELKSRQLEIASQHKSEFLANMSHELRTPLNAIIGFSEVLSERMFGEINEKQAEYIGDILESGQHLLSLINDILDLSKIEAGRMELEVSDFDLPGTIENTLTLVRERAVRRGITLGRTLDERLGSIRADERKVKQVLLNLLSNALKFTPEGGKIDVRAAVNDGVAEISVTDTGVGIAPEEQEAVFEEFRQVGTASKKVEGTGLGLAISRKFIELHGGKIWVKSQVGSGSTFAFTLPLR